MNKPPEDIRQWIQELISRSASDQMLSQKRFEELLRRSSSGEINQAELRQEYLQFAQQEGLRYIRDLTRVGLGFYNTLLELNRQYNDRFYANVLHENSNGNGAGHHGNGASGNGVSAVSTPPRVVDMDFTGAAGSDVTRSFAIENQRSEAVAVGFLISEFTDSEGKSSFRPPLQFTPARFNLRPAEERMVTVSIPLLPEFFLPGQNYSATVIVSGFEQLQLRLNVTVEAPTQMSAVPEHRGPVFLPVEEQAAPPPAPASDDLSRIKGVGPAFRQKLLQGGVSTFDLLAECPPETLQRLLGASGAQRAQRQQWQAQARLASQGAWSALEVLQASL